MPPTTEVIERLPDLSEPRDNGSWTSQSRERGLSSSLSARLPDLHTSRTLSYTIYPYLSAGLSILCIIKKPSTILNVIRIISEPAAAPALHPYNL